MVAFGAQPNYSVSVSVGAFILLSMFMIKYAYSSSANTYFLFYCGGTMKMLSLTHTKMLSLTHTVLASSTLERG
jgi:hypothetical protein